MKNTTKYQQIEIKDKKNTNCTVKDIGISELNYLVIDLYYEKEQKTISHIVGNWKDYEKTFISLIFDRNKE